MFARKYWSVALALGLAAYAFVPARAADFPDHRVRLLVGFAPGGGTDVLARLIAQNLSQKWGQPVTVDNRPGADGTIAEDLLAHAPGDGYTIMMTNNNFTVTPSEHKLNFDPVRDITPVVLVARAPDVLVINPAYVKADSVKDLMAQAKSQPGKFNYGSTGVGGPPYLEMELLKRMAGVDVKHIPYDGSAPATTALLGGEVQMTFASIQGSLANIQAGKLKPLGVSTSFRSSSLPDVPTVAESAGIPDYDGGGSWYGIIASGNPPPEILAKLHDDIVNVVKSPEVQKILADQGFITIAGTPPQFRDFIATDIPKWGAFLKNASAQ